jgi:organic radical activating enzyme
MKTKAVGSSLISYKGNKLVIDPEAQKARLKDLNARIEQTKSTMNAALLEAVDKIRVGIDGLLSKGIKRIWKMGEYLYKIDTEVEVFGPGAMPKLAVCLNYSSSQLYKWKRVYEDYDIETINWLTELRSSISGNAIGSPHIEAVSSVASIDARKELLSFAATNDMTADELLDHVKALGGKEKAARRGGGRPVKVPPTYTARLENLNNVCRQIVRNDKEIWRNAKAGFLNSLSDVPTDKLPKVVSQISTEAAQLHMAISKLNEVYSELIKAKSAATVRINEQAKVNGKHEGKAAKSRNGKAAAKVVAESKPEATLEESDDVDDGFVDSHATLVGSEV